MPFCPNCGKETTGRFCPGCGTRIESGDPSSVPPSSIPPPPASAAPNVLPENAASALCYALFLISGILFLVLEPYSRNRTIRFHAFQSIFFSIATSVLWIAFTVVATIFSAVPFLGWAISVLLWAALSIGVLICWLLLMWKAYNNERWVLPVIGPLAEKQS